MPAKRKAAPASVGYSDSAGSASNKRSAKSEPASKAAKRSSSPSEETKPTNGTKKDFDHSRVEERVGIVQRDFYPAEMSNERCEQYNNDEIPRPIEVLEKTIADTKEERARIAVGDAVVHWFKRDLRTSDNKGLSLAARKAKEAGVPLVCVFVVSPQDYQAHFTGAPRVDFELRTLAVLKRDLAELDVPLLVETVEERGNVMPYLVDKCNEWGAKHLFCNMEYEVDELRREALLTKKCLDAGIDFTVVHDDVVVSPGALQTGQGKQYAVYSPWFRSWVAHVHKHPELLDEHPRPVKNPAGAREKFKDVFESGIPEAPESKRLDPETKKRLASLWPAGEHEARERLGNMFKPFKYEYTNIEWEYNDDQFSAWCSGHTGFPIVDAAMRQINHMGYMHNRCRMIVASFLSKDLLIDWRMGERYFMEHLVDGDFASNNGGWGFSASVGVDPQPYFRIFNPLLQSEKFDPDGEYIRKWLPELKDVKGKAIHDPYGRGAEDIAKKNGYPRPIVEHKACRERALARYKAGIGRETA
ncbi:putative deoxyribodipyrimidine photo-lyase [Diplodia seriata]|uniref:Putative deoxyribodipyrimidine photo-lyase n=1 Tax=Diplodia seriata TaxID=420778 RepID=A0A0G2EA78_9PEZI|nr:putative deoxyribodipyrimidine photo-lyase [Diplodia seriata]